MVRRTTSDSGWPRAGGDARLPTNLTDTPGNDEEPDWSPSGERLVFASDRDGNGEVYSMDADGDKVSRLTKNGSLDVMPDWRRAVKRRDDDAGRDGAGGGLDDSGDRRGNRANGDRGRGGSSDKAGGSTAKGATGCAAARIGPDG